MKRKKAKPPHPDYVDREVIRITRHGVWLADGDEITHEPTRRLFARSLKKDEEGYFLQIGREEKAIEVEDTAYFVTRIFGNPNEGYTLQISDETTERLIPTTLRHQPERLTCQIKNGQETAKFLRNPYLELLNELSQDTEGYYLEFTDNQSKLRIKL